MISAAIVGLGRWGRNIVNAVQGQSKCLRFVLDAFADAAAGRAPFPVTSAQMVATVAAPEAMNMAMAANAGVRV